MRTYALAGLALAAAAVALALAWLGHGLKGAAPPPGTDRPRDAAGPAGSGGPAAPGGTPPPAASPEGIGLAPLASGFDRPVYVTHAGDGSGRLFVVEQTGRVWLLRGGRRAPEPFLDASDRIATRGPEQGLFSIAFHPRFAQTGYVFASYTARDGASVVERYRVDRTNPDRVDPATATPVLRVPQPYANHNGGLVLFGPDGYLYLGLGDGGGAGDPQGNGQDTETLLGKILRLDVDVPRGYRVPAGNPFVGKPGRDEIWAYGLRNPWRFSFDRETGDLYIADVGQDRREEVDFEPAGSGGGRNYGWNAWEGSLRFSRRSEAPGAVFPVAEYRNPEDGCSITGGYVFRGRAIPALRGVYAFGDYCSGTIWGLVRRGGDWRTAVLLETGLRISSFGEDADGELYVVDHGGAVYRLAPGEAEIPASLRAVP